MEQSQSLSSLLLSNKKLAIMITTHMPTNSCHKREKMVAMKNLMFQLVSIVVHLSSQLSINQDKKFNLNQPNKLLTNIDIISTISIIKSILLNQEKMVTGQLITECHTLMAMSMMHMTTTVMTT
jgi:hypothetical protein